MASSIRYESSTRTMNAGGALQQFDFSPSLPLTSGSQYVAFLSIANLPDQPESNFGMPYGAGQIPGEFVYTNNGPSPTQPTTLLLWGTAMAGLGLARRRRSRKSQ